MSIAVASKWSFLGAGIVVLACIPAVFLAERYSWSQFPIHSAQFLAAALCFTASLVFLGSTKGLRSTLEGWLAIVAAVLSGVWIAIFVFVVFFINFDSMGQP
jgi:hypothetical protein